MSSWRDCRHELLPEERPRIELLLHPAGGNIRHPHHLEAPSRDSPTIAALNTLIDPLASTIGNHGKLDMGQAVFKQRVDGFPTSEFVQATFLPRR